VIQSDSYFEFRFFADQGRCSRLARRALSAGPYAPCTRSDSLTAHDTRTGVRPINHQGRFTSFGARKPSRQQPGYANTGAQPRSRAGKPKPGSPQFGDDRPRQQPHQGGTEDSPNDLTQARLSELYDNPGTRTRHHRTCRDSDCVQARVRGETTLTTIAAARLETNPAQRSLGVIDRSTTNGHLRRHWFRYRIRYRDGRSDSHRFQRATGRIDRATRRAVFVGSSPTTVTR